MPLYRRDLKPVEGRDGLGHTHHFSDLAAAVAALPRRTLVLDGEVAIFDSQLRSRFDRFRERDPDAVATAPDADDVRSAQLFRPRSRLISEEGNPSRECPSRSAGGL